MGSYVAATIFTLVVWWASTGVIIYLAGLPRPTFKFTLLGTTVVTILALAGLWYTRNDSTIWGAYAGFVFGLLAWAWQEVSYYTGYVTGVRNTPCPEGCSGFKHFIHAVQASIFHELAIVAAATIVLALTWNSPNFAGAATFFMLWWMHQSAKLNVFFGARNLNEEFLPPHLQYLKSFFTKKSMNLFFPVSVSVSTVIGTWLFMKAFNATTDYDRVAYTLISVMMALAILEHWFLVVPLPSGKLWEWGLTSRAKTQTQPAEVVVVGGFLGAGKTTFLRRLLSDASPEERTLVLVNDFGAIGVDGSLLKKKGTDVVEFANGCVCCTLRNDLTKQLREMVVRWAPKRVYIEPSGVAELGSFLGTLYKPELKPYVKTIQFFGLVDAGRFMSDYAERPEYFEAQANIASALIVNKADLISDGQMNTIKDTLRTLNPALNMVPASYGRYDANALKIGDLTPQQAAHAEHEPALDAIDEPEHDHDHVHENMGLAFDSWSNILTGCYDQDALRALIKRMAAGEFGKLARAKGILPVPDGWVHFDLTGQQISIAAFAPAKDEQPRAVAIGTGVKGTELQNAFDQCRLTSAEFVRAQAPQVTVAPSPL
jgi:putative photosynthetic complex assembly protein 2